MAIETRPSASPTAPPSDARILGMACRNCRRSQQIGLSYVCVACFGPLEVQYDYAVAARTFTREAIATRQAATAPSEYSAVAAHRVAAAPAHR